MIALLICMAFQTNRERPHTFENKCVCAYVVYGRKLLGMTNQRKDGKLYRIPLHDRGCVCLPNLLKMCIQIELEVFISLYFLFK